MGSGETVIIPLNPSGTLTQAEVTILTYPESYPYSNTGVEAKWPTRQSGPHVHGLTTDSKGRVYICDLGSDAIWIAEPTENGIEVIGMMDRERGDTPRHALVSDDGESPSRS